MYRFPSQSKDEIDLRKLSETISDSSLKMVIHTIMGMDMKLVDPKYSMHKILTRIINGLNVLQEPNADQKNFKESLDKIKDQQ